MAGPRVSCSEVVLSVNLAVFSPHNVKLDLLVVTHTHIVHLVSLSIFFGPIAVLIPLLFLHELVVSILFNLSFIFHGLLPGTVDDHYLYLSSIFDDLKGFTFSCVDRLGARYNKLTTESWCLLILRLFCLGLGSLALYHIVIEN
ncbi:hypothetical protein J132_09706 [Termitomyces sp. J132]|nr:hypothetical protein H2248_009185 [Termitomyces sp. 'cryptogamus']KNZ73804.1 hypothetical protein J132_09706 [Termitomyces sp. J132]